MEKMNRIIELFLNLAQVAFRLQGNIEIVDFNAIIWQVQRP